jgi:uncharacterized protein YfaS (alpha-2-macroglobulin family)
MRIAVLATLATAALAATVIGGPPTQVERFTPSGTVAGPEQIAIRFSRAMVALGDPSLPAPITGTCSTGAAGRWVDTQSYAIDLAAPLPGGQRCVYDLVPGLKDAAGTLVTGPRRFTFATPGPQVRALVPDYGTIEEDQVFLLALDAIPTPESVAAHAACLIDGVGEAVPLDILPQAERDKILTGSASDYRVRSLLETAGWRTPEYGDTAPRARAAIIAAKCRRTLPSGGKVTLNWGADIATANGITAGTPWRQTLAIRPAFTARLECARVNAAAACSPLEPLRLAFAGQVPLAQAMAVRLVAADGKTRSPTPPKQRAASLDRIEFAGPHTERSRYRLVLPAGLSDDAGRPLANAARFPLDIATGDFPPLAKFAGTFGILEANEGGVLPVTLRGVESPLPASKTLAAASLPVTSDAAVATWLRKLDKAEERTSIEEPIAGSDETRRIETTRNTPLIAPGRGKGFTITRDKDPRSFEVVGIPLKQRGFHVVEIASPMLGAGLLGPGKTRYVATGALVTDMAVHFQWGRGRSLVWVTSLADAKPVAGARIAITDSCTGTLLWQGQADKSGRASVGDALPPPASYGSCDYGTDHPLLVSARTPGDYSFTLSSWGNGIQGSDFGLSQGYGFEPTAIHAVFDRTLLRTGETVHAKLIVRARTDRGFERAAPITATKVTIRHLGSDASFETPLTMRGNSGTLDWTVPPTAALGSYSLELPGADGYPRSIGSFRVEEYRLPTIRASVTGPKAPQVAPTSVPVDLALTYLSGGAVASAPVKLRSQVAPRSVSVDGFDDWTFNGEIVKAGVVALDGDGNAPESNRAPMRSRVEPVTLGPKGVARVVIGDLEPVTSPSVLIAEMDYDDANGEVATTGTRVLLEPAAVRVGIRSDGWLAKSDDLRLALVALDLQNRPVKGQKLKVQLFSRETYSYRKRLIGGFYAYDNSRETKLLDADCSGTTDAQGRLSCQIDAGVSGEVVAQVEARDSAGRTARATKSVWLAGDDDWWFGGDNGDRMDVVAETPQVAANGIARLQVRMPFREATALVTVMRDGVLDSFVTTLSGKDPVVNVQMKAGYAPNVYVSVLAVRGRVAGWRLWLADFARKWNIPWISREAASPTALIDLAKPSYRIGMAKLQVGWDAHKLGVTVTPDRPSYAVRSAGNATIKLTPPGRKPLPAGAEIAFAAVDEALLQLAPNESWDLLGAMMAERPLGVTMATAQMQVVGKRHYGRKAVAAGGGGGASAGMTRRDFTPVLLWNARVPVDAKGQAQVPFRLNDSLSGFRLVAVATAGEDLFGTGMVTIRTTQDLQLLPGIPPLVRDGDTYVATVLARNTTTAPMQVRLTGNAGTLTLPPLALAIPPGGAATAAWRVMAPPTGPIVWSIAAKAASGPSDAVSVTQAIAPAVPDQVLQATFFQSGAAGLPIARPADALPGRGGLDVALSPSLGGKLPGVRAYMAAYPYDCIEQRLSRAIATGDRAAWDAAALALPAYLDPDGLVRFFPADWLAGDDALTAYILRLSANSGWPLPESARAAMIRGLTGFVAGTVQRPHDRVVVVEKSSGDAALGDLGGDRPIRHVTALAALATVGAATPKMAEPINITPDAWPTVTVIDWIETLVRLPTIANSATRRAQAETILRSRLDNQGTTLRITRADSPFQLLASPDSTTAQLTTLASKLPAWRSDAPRIARALVLQQQRGHWDTTPANALGTLAMRDFAAAFEAAPVTGTTKITLGDTAKTFAWPSPPPQTLPWPTAKTTLNVAHNGAGQPWVMLTTRAAVPLAKPFSSGFTLSRQVTPVTQATPGRWTRGDVMRIRLTITPRAPVEWVVINDPVPAGATILGGGLGGRSQILAAEGTTTGTPPSFVATFVERRTDAVHAHYQWLDRTPVTYEYTLRLGSTGRFQLPPTRVEALYSPEMLALLPNAAVTVAPVK